MPAYYFYKEINERVRNEKFCLIYKIIYTMLTELQKL